MQIVNHSTEGVVGEFTLAQRRCRTVLPLTAILGRSAELVACNSLSLALSGHHRFAGQDGDAELPSYKGGCREANFDKLHEWRGKRPKVNQFPPAMLSPTFCRVLEHLSGEYR